LKLLAHRLFLAAKGDITNPDVTNPFPKTLQIAENPPNVIYFTDGPAGLA
jgi:hypothetical protein